MQVLIIAGLFKLEPRLEDRNKSEKLADTMVCLRKPFNSPQAAPMAAYDEVRKTIIIIGPYFRGQWNLIITIICLALKPRQTNNPVIIGGTMALFAEIYQLTCRRSIAF